MTRSSSSTKDMTSGNIVLLLVGFSIPLILGNLFQMLYNTADSLIVGNFVGTEALAAIGSTTTIVNMLVFFFNGVSIGATVVISRSFGAGDEARLHDAIETTIFITLIASVLFTVIGILLVKPMLLFMSTPDDVMGEATVYLTIYFAGISGLLVYNMGSGILRAVGDTRNPLIFLIITSILNIVLDLVFVLVFHSGVAGAAWATIISQFISAFLILLLLTRSKDIYRLTWRDLHCNGDIFKEIIRIGLPAGIQSIITSFSNVFVQSYINVFGSTCMAGWSCYNKLDQFLLLPVQSFAQAATTFIGQNIGAGKMDRVRKGTVDVLILVLCVCLVITSLLFIFAPQANGIFTNDAAVVEFGILFLRTNVFFMLFNSINHTLAGALRGRGDSTGPMVIMIMNFVVVRQIYLFIVTHFISNTPQLVGFGYPVGWMACAVTECVYFYFRWFRKEKSLEN